MTTETRTRSAAAVRTALAEQENDLWTLFVQNVEITGEDGVEFRNRIHAALAELERLMAKCGA